MCHRVYLSLSSNIWSTSIFFSALQSPSESINICRSRKLHASLYCLVTDCHQVFHDSSEHNNYSIFHTRSNLQHQCSGFLYTISYLFVVLASLLCNCYTSMQAVDATCQFQLAFVPGLAYGCCSCNSAFERLHS